MNTTLKIVRMGNSAAVVLPRKLMERLSVSLGDRLTLVDTEHGVELSRAEDDFEEQMAVAREVMMRRRQALRELAK